MYTLKGKRKSVKITNLLINGNKHIKLACGEDSGQSKLNWEKVREIRELAKKEWKRKDIALKFSVNVATIGRILKGELWKIDAPSGS